MKKIRSEKHPYKLEADIRKDELRVGKYIYLTMLTIIAFMLIHILFGHWYLLGGDGFIYSKQDAVEVEFDAHINHVFVSNGEEVKKGAKLFTFSSLDFERMNQQYVLSINQLGINIEKNTKELKLIEENLLPFEKYLAFQDDFYKKVARERVKGLAHLFQLSTEYQRSMNARNIYLNLKRKSFDLQMKIDNDLVLINDAKLRQRELLQSYGKGEMHAPVSGVISDLKLIPGDVLPENTRALNIFHGKRYVYGYFTPRTFVSFDVGSKIVVDLPRIGKVQGVITRLLPITDKLPEEFQPRFKTRQRQQIFIVELNGTDLDKLPILTTVKIYRSVGHDLFVKLYNYVVS